MKILKISFFVMVLGFFNLVSALEAPENVVLDKAWENDLEISWNTASWAELYAVSYWKKPALDWSYEHELEIVVNTDAKTIIENLESDTNYYIAVKSYDSLENESNYSEEVSFSTLWEVKELKIDSINVSNVNTLDISFNSNLKNDIDMVSVNIIDSDNSLEDVEISKYEIDNNVLKIHLSNQLNKLQKYSATVVSLEWENWEKIKSWVDWVIHFEVPENFEDNTSSKEELDNSETTEEIIDLNSASEVEPNDISWTWSSTSIIDVSKNEDKALGWKDMNDSDGKAIESVAKDKEDLPTTGPTETLLFLLLSFIVWALILMSRRKSNS